MLEDIELMMRMRFCGHLLYHRYPMSMSQNRILLILHREGPLKQKDLLERMNIKPGSLSEIISKVEAGGYVVRRKCPGDKRSLELILTDRGIERAEVFEKERSDLAKELFSDLTREEKDELFRILGMLEAKWIEGLDIHRPPHLRKGENSNA